MIFHNSSELIKEVKSNAFHKNNFNQINNLFIRKEEKNA